MTAVAVMPGTDEWLEERKKYVGASDAPAIMGLTPGWRTARDVAQEKAGEDSGADEEESRQLRRGRVLEPLVKRIYIEKTGNEIFSAPMYRHRTHQWMSATPDGWVVTKDEEILIECKTASRFVMHEWVDIWDDDQEYDIVPAKYWVQLQHQMAVTEQQKVIVAVMFASEDLFDVLVSMVEQKIDIEHICSVASRSVEFKIIEVKRDQEFIDKLIGVEEEFWRNVCDGVIPQEQKHTRDSGAIRVAGYEEENLLTDMKTSYLQKLIAEGEFEECCNKVKQAIGLDSGLYSDFLGKVTYRRSGPRSKVNWKNLAQDLLARYVPEVEQEVLLERYSKKSEAVRKLVFPYQYWKMN